MNIKRILIPLLLAISLSSPAIAKNTDTSELAAPIIELMPAFKKVRADLKLDEKQAKTIDAWMAEAPAKKKELKQEALVVRTELRDALITRTSRMKREELKFKLGEANRRIIEIQSLCARMLNDTLTKEQYAKVIDAYKQSRK